MYSPSHSSCDGDKGFVYHPWFCMVLVGESCVVLVFMCEGLVEEFDVTTRVTISEFKELDCGFGGGFYICLYVAWCANYAQDSQS